MANPPSHFRSSIGVDGCKTRPTVEMRRMRILIRESRCRTTPTSHTCSKGRPERQLGEMLDLLNLALHANASADVAWLLSCEFLTNRDLQETQEVKSRADGLHRAIPWPIARPQVAVNTYRYAYPRSSELLSVVFAGAWLVHLIELPVVFCTQSLVHLLCG